MQFFLSINQLKAVEWGLNAQQAMLFSFIYTVPSWASEVTKDGVVYYAISKAKICEELPLLTDKPDTAYRLLKQLTECGLIELSSTSRITLVRLTEKAKQWNGNHSEERKNILPKSEKNPTTVGKKSDVGSEKNPTNHNTNNQDTKSYCPYDEIVALYHEILPEFPEMRVWSPKRRKQIKERWNHSENTQSLEWWKEFFEYIREQRFLMQAAAQKKSWCDLEFLTNPNKFAWIIDGKYASDAS